MFCIDNLDEQQVDAVMSSSRNTLVVASPGSGKTTVIINRCLYLIEKLKVNPNNIIVITFTKAAAVNMKNRFQNICEGRFKTPFFGTFHGLFYKILCRHFGNINIIGGEVSYRLIKNVLSSYMDSINEDKVKQVINSISLYKTSNSDDFEKDINIDMNIFKQCFSTYENYKKEKGLLDFDDLQINIKKLFNEDKNLLQMYSRNFEHILVDEFQDCDGLQIEILNLLNRRNSIFAVGDEDQCIYSFRGSRPDCMVNFDREFKDSKKIFLKTNYRSPKNIVQCSKELINNNAIRNKKDMCAFNDIEKSVEVMKVLDEREQSEKIKEKIVELLKKGYNYKESAVIYRTNIESRALIDTFLKYKIPFRFLDKQYNFFNHFICKDLIAYLKLSIDERDRDCFSSIINKPFRYISKTNIEKVKNHRTVDSCFEILQGISDIPYFQLKVIKKLQDEVQRLKTMRPYDAVHFIINNMNYKEYIEEYCIKYKLDKEEYKEIMDEFLESSSDFEDIFVFLEHISRVEEELNNNETSHLEDAVIFSTIHGVKGMEYKNIFIINCVEENIPHQSGEIEEERRIFYVAITRTIDNLWIGIPLRVRGKIKEASSFIGEAKLLKEESLNEGFLKLGDKVFHKSFGHGTVLKIDKGIIKIAFNDGTDRSFNLEVVIKNNLISKV